MRWTAKKALSKTVVTGSVLDFVVYAAPSNIGPKGLNFRVFINGKLWDEINFFGEQIRHLTFYIPYRKNELLEIKTVVNRTFIPVRLGLNRDSRALGVGLSEFKFCDGLPVENTGFFGMETWGRPQPPGWPQHMPIKIRWTGLRASMNLKDKMKDGATIFLLSSHPDIENNPVKVEIWGEGRVIEEVTLKDHHWAKIRLNQEKLTGSNILTFHVDRVWNPKLSGFSEDNRDLGVAVAILDH